MSWPAAIIICGGHESRDWWHEDIHGSDVRSPWRPLDNLLLFFTFVMLNAGVLLLMNLDLPIAQRLQSFSKHGGGGSGGGSGGGGGQLLSNASNSHETVLARYDWVC